MTARHRLVPGRGAAWPVEAGPGMARQGMDRQAEAPTRAVEQTRVRATDKEKHT